MVQSKHVHSKPKLTPEEFVLQAIATLKTEKFKGVHVVRSGFNQAFRDYFGNEVDPVATTTQMRKDRKVAVFLAKGGALLYLREDLKDATLTRHDTDWEKRDSEGLSKKAAPKQAAEGDDVLSRILKG